MRDGHSTECEEVRALHQRGVAAGSSSLLWEVVALSLFLSSRLGLALLLFKVGFDVGAQARK